MSNKKFNFIKFSLLDELLGFAYWVCVLCGLFFIANNVYGAILLAFSLLVYICITAVVYILIIKKLNKKLLNKKA